MKLTKIISGLTILGASALFASDGATLFKACATCHGVNGEKAALGKSQVIKGWDVAKVEKALHGYKNGTYGGPMKGVMKGQVARLSDSDIKAIAEHLASLK